MSLVSLSGLVALHLVCTPQLLELDHTVSPESWIQLLSSGFCFLHSADGSDGQPGLRLSGKAAFLHNPVHKHVGSLVSVQCLKSTFHYKPPTNILTPTLACVRLRNLLSVAGQTQFTSQELLPYFRALSVDPTPPPWMSTRATAALP